MKDLLYIILFILLIALLIALGVWWDIYRWHTFQEVTHSSISWWKYHILFDHHTTVRGGK